MLEKFQADGVASGSVATNAPAGDNQITGNQSTEKTEIVNDDFLKADPNKKEISNDEMEKLVKINKSLQSNYDKQKLEFDKINAELKKEREKTLTQKQLEELKEQEIKQQVDAQKKELELEKIKFSKTKLIFEKGWDMDFLQLVEGDDIETFTSNCKVLQEKFDKLLEKKIQERLSNGNPTPKTGGNVNSEDVFTIEEINTLPKQHGAEWVVKNNDKMIRSLNYWKNKGG